MRAGDPRLEDKVPREFSGLAVRENASGVTKLRAERDTERKNEIGGERDDTADKYISRLNPASREIPEIALHVDHALLIRRVAFCLCERSRKIPS